MSIIGRGTMSSMVKGGNKYYGGGGTMSIMGRGTMSSMVKGDNE